MAHLTKPGANERRLLSNTVLLYIMNFSAQLFGIVTLPYLSRVFGPSVYGKIGIATSFMAYVQIVIDFGFLLSATQKASEHRDDKEYLGRLMTSVTLLKLMLSLAVTAVFAAIVLTSDMAVDWPFYFLYLGAQVANAFMPDYLFRGLEKMSVITYRTIAIKAAFMLLVFLFIRGPEDLFMVPLFTLLGNGVAVVTMYYHAVCRLGISFAAPTIEDVRRHFVDSAQFFASRVASVVYQSTNAIILNYLYGAGEALIGYYTSAEKFVALVRSGSAPIADSLFPYMVKNKNYRLVKKLLFVAMPLVIAGTVLLFIFACPICAFVFGDEYYEAGYLLQLLVPYMIVIFPNYLLAFPIMVPLGLTAKTNFSSVLGMIIQLGQIGLLALVGHLDVYTICAATSVTEVAVCLFRAACVLREIRRRRAA